MADQEMSARGEFADSLADNTGTERSEKSKEERDRELVARCMEMVAAGAEVTEEWADLRMEGLRYVFNDQLAGKKRDSGWDHVEVNVIYPGLHQELALLAQRRPKVEVDAGVQADPEAVNKAAFWRGLTQRRYDKTLQMRTKTILATLDGAWSGWYIAYIWPDERAYWDSDRRKWMYEPRVELLHPMYFGSDPNSETIEGGEFVFSRREMAVEQAKRLWPGKVKEIDEKAKAYRERGNDIFLGRRIEAGRDQRKGDKERETGELDAHGELFRLLTRARTEVAGGRQLSDEDGGAKRAVVPITVIHFRDYEEQDATREEPYSADELLALGAITADTATDGGPAVYRVADPEHPVFEKATREYQPGDLLSEADWPQKVLEEFKEPVYPFGRVVWLLDEDVLLNDKQEDQVWTRRRWPYEVGVRLPLPHISQGLNGVEMARGPQDWINVSAAHMLNHLKHFSDPRTIVEEGTLKKGSKLKAIAGSIIHVLGGKAGGIKHLTPPEMSAGIMQVFQIMVRQAQDALKQHDNALGAPSPQDQTATASTIQQAATQTAVGLSIVFLDDWILRVMEQVMELDREYLEPGDAVRLAGTTDTPEAVVEYTDEIADVDVDLKLNVGVALPHDIERRKSDLERLQRMYPDNPFLVEWAAEVFDVPDKRKFIEASAIIQAVKQFAAQQQAMAQTASNPAQAGAVPGAGGQPAPAQQPVPPA